MKKKYQALLCTLRYLEEDVITASIGGETDVKYSWQDKEFDENPWD
jgi:hypothetical protein